MIVKRKYFITHVMCNIPFEDYTDHGKDCLISVNHGKALLQREVWGKMTGDCNIVLGCLISIYRKNRHKGYYKHGHINRELFFLMLFVDVHRESNEGIEVDSEKLNKCKQLKHCENLHDIIHYLVTVNCEFLDEFIT